MIVVGGLKRSGTTWQYNVIRIALTQARVKFTPCGSFADLKTATHMPLLKSHWWQAPVARRARQVFTSHRDVLEVYQSLTRLQGRPPTGAELAKIVEHWRRWDRDADYRMPYRRLLEDPETVCREIVSTLDVGADPGRVYVQVSRLRPPEEGQDPVTLLFHNHITS